MSTGDEPRREPALFIGHGSPMNTLELNSYTESWRRLGSALARPKAILSVSAHWYIGYTAATAMEQPRTIHDFFGFPQALFDYEYPAPGDPTLAERISELVAPIWVGADEDSWGIDHGTWSLLAHMAPDADIPVVQLSINATKPPEFHLELGRRIAPMRDEGVMVLCSGNVVHNLRRIDPAAGDEGEPWASVSTRRSKRS